MRVFIGALCWLCLSLSSALAEEIDHRDYRLGAGDRLRVTVFGEPDLSGEFRIGSEGGLALPLIPRLQADGLKVTQLEHRIQASLKDGYLIRPRVSVEVLTYRKFYVWGEVRDPGSYPFEAGLTVLRAVSIAGGLTEFGEEKFVELYRRGREEKPVEASFSTMISPGDVIRVPED